MLTEQRLKKILSIIEEKRSASVQELMELLETSESTIRRDLAVLDENKQIYKVRGGALAMEASASTMDFSLQVRQDRNKEEKTRIARYAASLIKADDFVYLDAGTTTEQMIDYITVKNISFVTNSVNHAKRLSSKGYVVYLLGGEFKLMTEAIVGAEALESLEKYNFTKGFWGTNGASREHGYTTPDLKEALVKKKSMEHCKEPYVLCDSSKLSTVSSVTFGDFLAATVITSICVREEFKGCQNVIETDISVK